MGQSLSSLSKGQVGAMELVHNVPDLEMFIDKTIKKCLLEYDLDSKDTESLLDDLEMTWPGRSDQQKLDKNVLKDCNDNSAYKADKDVILSHEHGSDVMNNVYSKLDDNDVDKTTNNDIKVAMNISASCVGLTGEESMLKLALTQRVQSSITTDPQVIQMEKERSGTPIAKERGSSSSPELRDSPCSTTGRHAKLKSRLQQRYFEDNRDSYGDNKATAEVSSNNTSIHDNFAGTRSPVSNVDAMTNGDAGRHNHILEIDSRNLNLLAQAAKLHTESSPQRQHYEDRQLHKQIQHSEQHRLQEQRQLIKNHQFADQRLHEWEEREITKHFCGSAKVGTEEIKEIKSFEQPRDVMTRYDTSVPSGINSHISKTGHHPDSTEGSINCGDQQKSLRHFLTQAQNHNGIPSQESKTITTNEGRTTLLEQELLKSDKDLERRARILIEQYQKGYHAARETVALTQELTNGRHINGNSEVDRSKENGVFGGLSNDSSTISQTTDNSITQTNGSHTSYINANLDHNVLINGNSRVTDNQFNNQTVQTNPRDVHSHQNQPIPKEKQEPANHKRQYRLYSNRISVSQLPHLVSQTTRASPVPAQRIHSQQGINNNQQSIANNHQQIIANNHQQAISNNHQSIANNHQQAIANNHQQAISNNHQQAISNNHQAIANNHPQVISNNHHQAIANNQQQVIANNHQQQIIANNHQQIIANNHQQVIANNQQQVIANNHQKPQQGSNNDNQTSHLVPWPRMHQHHSRMTNIIVEQLKKPPISPGNNVPFIGRIMAEDMKPLDQRRLRQNTSLDSKASVQLPLVSHQLTQHLSQNLQTIANNNIDLQRAEHLLRSQSDVYKTNSQALTVNVPAFLPSHPSLVHAHSVKPSTPPHLRHHNHEVTASHDLQSNEIPKDLSLDNRQRNCLKNSELQSLNEPHVVIGLDGQKILVSSINNNDTHYFKSSSPDSRCSPSQSSPASSLEFENSTSRQCRNTPTNLVPKVVLKDGSHLKKGESSSFLVTKTPDFDSKILADKRRMVAMAQRQEARNREFKRHRDRDYS